MAADEITAKVGAASPEGKPVYPMQARAVSAILYEGLGSTDTVTGHVDPETDFIDGGTAGRHKHIKGITGTLMALSVLHDGSSTFTTQPVFNIYGKVGGYWQRLYTIEDTPSSDVTVTLASTDVESSAGSGRFMSDVSGKAVIVDLRGASELVVALKTAASNDGTEADQDLYGFFF